MISPDDALIEKQVRLTNAIRVHDFAGCIAALNDGAEPNYDIADTGQGMLYRSIDAGFFACARLLLDRGAHANGINPKYRPLNAAAQKGSIEIMRALLDSGANVNAKGMGDDSALHFAARWTNIDAIGLLLSNGANPHATNGYYQTALHEAAITTTERTIPALRALVEGGARPSFAPPTPPHYYRTPTQHAAFHGKHPALSYFLNVCSEDPNQRALNGKSLTSIAGDLSTKQLILLAIASRSITNCVEAAIEETSGAPAASNARPVQPGPI
jgi:hypothetical protein